MLLLSLFWKNKSEAGQNFALLVAEIIMRQPLSGCFKKGKETLKKKAKELSTLCDIPVCAVIISPRGTTETWPESQNDVKTIFDAYKKKVQIFDDHHDGRDLDRSAVCYETDDHSHEFPEIEIDDHDEIMECLNSKIKAVERRIVCLEKMNGNKIKKEADLTDLLLV